MACCLLCADSKPFWLLEEFESNKCQIFLGQLIGCPDES